LFNFPQSRLGLKLKLPPLKSIFAEIGDRPVPLRLGLFVLILLLIWLPLAGPIYLIWGPGNTVSIVTMVLLYCEFVGLLRFWGKTLYQRSHPLRDYGLEGSAQFWQEALLGLGLGLGALFALFGLEGALGWLDWNLPAANFGFIFLEGLAVSLGVGFAEELLFRGWLLQELERDYSLPLALWADSLIFALLHFIRPWEMILQTWTQFIGLVLLGLSLVWFRRRSQGRLGASMGLHGGLVWSYYLINVGNLITYTGQVPTWVTGINQNPLAGLMGLVFLTAIALGIRYFGRTLESSRQF
jgi:uncharacterized protein